MTYEEFLLSLPINEQEDIKNKGEELIKEERNERAKLDMDRLALVTEEPRKDHPGAVI